MSAFVEPLQITDAGDDDKPAWLACDRASICMLRRAGTTKRVNTDGTWLTPDGDGSLVVWGVDDEVELDAALRRWRGGKQPATKSGAWTGFIEPGAFLAQWKPKTQRAKELVERVTFQAGRIDYVVTIESPTVLDAELRMTPRPGEPVFVGDLGRPSADLTDLSGLADPEMLGAVRIAADPAKLWDLLRSVMGAEQRGGLDEMVAMLADEASLDVPAELFASLDGHIALFAYEFPTTPIEVKGLLELDATTETIVVGVKDRQRLRELLDAWTQLSAGRLQVQVSGETPTWAWLEDGELRWTAMLGEKHLLIADSDTAIERTKRWRDEPGLPLADKLADRGANGLFEGRDRSGAYLDLTKFKDAMPEHAASFPPIASITVTAEPHEKGEFIRVRLTTSVPIR